MRVVLGWLGNVLFVLGIGGVVLLAFGPPEVREQASEWAATLNQVSSVATPTRERAAERATTAGSTARGVVRYVDDQPPGSTAAGSAAPSLTQQLAPSPFPTATPAPRLPITRLEAPGIQLEAEVVVAHLLEQDGAVTWEVPAFKVGHAQYTAGAGERGNAVLIGHIDSRNSGNVFKDLDRVRVGETLFVFAGTRSFPYRVVEIRSVPRNDVSVVDPTDAASITLITCTGAWLPNERDFAERLVVRGELVSPEP